MPPSDVGPEPGRVGRLPACAGTSARAFKPVLADKARLASDSRRHATVEEIGRTGQRRSGTTSVDELDGLEQEPLDLAGGHGDGPEVALSEAAAEAAEHLDLLGFLDAFGDGDETE